MEGKVKLSLLTKSQSKKYERFQTLKVNNIKNFSYKFQIE